MDGFIFANESVIDKIRTLDSFNHKGLITVPSQLLVDMRLKEHPDLSLFIGKQIWIHESIESSIKPQMLQIVDEKWYNSHVVVGNAPLSICYPQDIPYNAVQLSRHFFHRLDVTEPKLIDFIKNGTSLELIHVRQGYTRCSSLVVGSNSVITEDQKLHETFVKYGYHSLLIPPGQVTLDGFEHGFIGGVGGTIEKTVVINGSLKQHTQGERIKDFILAQHYQICELSHNELEDCGSIFYYPLEK